jgi:hypothetical protein
LARLFLQRFYFWSDFSDWLAGGIQEPLSQLEYCEEMAFGLKAFERAGDRNGGGEKGVDPVRPPLDEYPGSDVFILLDTETTCGEALSNLSEYDLIGKSVTIISADDDFNGVLFHHCKDERIARPNSFKRGPSEFWNKYISPVINLLNSVF